MTPAAPKKKTVLIVEDDPGMLEFLKAVTEREGYAVVTATDGLEAVEKMRKLLPDTALLDLMLPSYGGFELLHELKRGETAVIPVIVVTARFTSAADRAAIARFPNVAAFLEKPVPPEVLVNALRELLGS